ncbi:deoxyribodipyrimidine photo-lyase [Luedemannella helvata]|uniref:Deoxyribodipyrimidine photo-lyase n=1 Tax=Luedemannella helvata TaxID=349315 RepID=A0ABP4W634_9ACTN
MRTAIALVTRDLRVRDNPALALACANAERVVPLFVRDPTMPGGAVRWRFLDECLADLRGSLRDRGGDLVIRHGDVVAETLRLAGEVDATLVTVAGDVSSLARRRERRLAEECETHRIELVVTPGVTVVPPGALRPAGGAASYRVFTPYWRAWTAATWRDVAPTPRRLTLPPGLDPGPLPPPGETPGAAASARSAVGGEAAARRTLRAFLPHLSGYAQEHDVLASPGTSRLSPYLRFGCLSPRELAGVAAGSEEFVRQLCWRDFFYQVTAAFPRINRDPLRPGGDVWRADDAAFAAWRDGRTGVPVVDAGMRQLAAEGWMHNRARMITAAFLTKHLGLDWRLGAGVFFDLLLDGDVPNNYGNWQWVAGTGNDTRPYRRFNPIRQAYRFDPDGDYVRRYVPELSVVDGPAVHEPWRLGRDLRYPPPLRGPAPAAWLPD